MRHVQFQPKIGKEIKNIEPGAENKHSLAKKKKNLRNVCKFQIYALNLFSLSTEQLACPKKHVSPRFNAA